MKTKVIAFLLVGILICSIFPGEVLANNIQVPLEKNIKPIPDKNILDQMKFPTKRDTSTGLVAHYKFDGNLEDSSSYGNDGKLSKGNIGYVKGKFGEAAKFDGKSYIEVLDNDSLDLDKKFSISLWMYKEEVYDYLPVLAKGLKGNPDTGIGIPYALFHGYAGTQPTMQIHSIEDWSEMAPFELYVDYHTMHMITITVDIPNKEIKHYLNGKLFTGEKPEWEFTSGELHKTEENLFVGGAYLDGEFYYFNGLMDDLRIYNRVLNADEISSLYIGEAQASNEYTSMIITPDKMSIMKEKGILYMNVMGIKADGQKDDITAKAVYSSSDEKVLTVDVQGKVVAIAKGVATITVSNGDLMKQIRLTVK